MVSGAGLSGLDALILSSADTLALDRELITLARKVIRGACDKIQQDDGSTKYRAWTNDRVCRELGLIPLAVSLRQRCLKMWQRVVGHPSEYKCLIAAFFGDLPGDVKPTLDSDGKMLATAHRWALQWA
eukprot:8477240-Pyramimonas_sp.AAC.1